MSESENKNTAYYSNRIIVQGFLGVVCMAGLLLILPLYMQNRMSRLYEESHKKYLEIGALERKIMLQEIKINKMSGLDELSKFADECGLGFNEIPVKVRIQEVSR